MGTLALLVAVLLSPTLIFGALLGAGRVYRRYQQARPALPATSTSTDLARVLRRLHGQLEDAENAPADTPGKNARCRAIRAAYVDVITDACVRFDVAAPEGSPVPDAELWRVECALRAQGLDVRPAA